ncbi:TIGR03364 family FAD-dependent oxidoreductase [Psychromicrobium xiongbiense]|uniref:TIGR03364 family FAD-dependent oxidoreductase n=1 Tax=Psychromicrobium xiongbiense TaxID=3051184 RepID=UPI002554DC00|nr:TIGR03364 family FAD-dependent oxidoreductase [Psychromicrobium sp. YIM S02556]
MVLPSSLPASSASSGDPLSTLLAEVDLLVVGAGIVGLAHAFEAHHRGLRVAVVDRDYRPTGASIRNFGHCCITAQSGELLELAMAGRSSWLAASAAAGFFSAESGALAVARSRIELQVLEELSTARDAGQVQLRTAAEVREALSGGQAEILGGAWLRDDLRVDPREAAPSLAAWLAGEGVQFFWNTSYLPTAMSGDSLRVQTSRGAIRAEQTIVCAGHDLDQLYPLLAADHEIRRCALQMARVQVPAGLRVHPAVLSGTSMLRYPAFTEQPAAARLRAEIAALDPAVVEIDANIMFTQRPDGTLLVGDSHLMDLAQEPFLSEDTSRVLLDRVARLLGGIPFRVLERWQGIYAASPQHPYLVAALDERRTAVSVTSGVGMTISFGLARKVLRGLGI